MTALTLTQAHFYTFLACPRRFYLRYLARVPWPEAPLGTAQEEAYDLGHRFHRRAERHFLGVADDEESDPTLRGWWDTFRRQGPPLPAGRRFVEAGLTVPIGNHFLTGRFDLLIVGADAAGQPAAHLFDWKPGDPRPLDRLRAAWQTRAYLAVLAQGGAALLPDAAEAFDPDRLSLTYWYAADPDHLIRPDPALGENFVFGPVAEGRYTAFVEVQGEEYRRTVEVSDGQVTTLEIVTTPYRTPTPAP